MPPKLKKVAADSQKQSREQTDSDRIYNARRRAKRALAKLQQDIDYVKTEAGQKTISQLQKLIDQSYARTKGKKRGQYLVETKYLEKRLEQGTQTFKEKGVTYRKNEIFKREINLAAKGDETSKLTKEQVNLFYAYTKSAWEGRPREKRNEAILKEMGETLLEEAWKKVFEDENVKKALERAEANQKPAESDEDIKQDENEPPDEAGSPNYVEYLIDKISTR